MKFKKKDICYVVAVRDDPNGRVRYLTLASSSSNFLELGLSLSKRDFGNTKQKDWLGKGFKVFIEEVK